MSKEAFVFPGQGSQKVGMGKEVYEAYDFVQKIYDTADSILRRHGWSQDLRELCFQGPPEILNLTELAQSAIYVTSLAYCELLKQERRIYPQGMVGHSLGEYAALTAAGFLAFPDGVRLVAERGFRMAEAGRENPGKMAAIVGLTLTQVEEVIGRIEGIFVANHNSPYQIVISGSQQAVELASEMARSAGARRAIPLNVSVAAHSPFMLTAANSLARFIQQEGVVFGKPQIPFYSSTMFARIEEPRQIEMLLLAQLTGRVQWVKTIEQMIADGYNRFLEVGPGKVLSGLIRKIDETVKAEAFNA